eukprot:CAMPEP_0174244550 /NCGR_PEP_ID=MMETSP0417-20130205/35579_1 /TAXON_ID=242541 /ORGANISM="Mayorella sp, Strain BSH-02190019" /LENGTH=501 /DNA_ID=CAMNT_0015324241 /DNA_START=42 /DNA_END=1543 /DNA_ORIENTATION=+
MTLDKKENTDVEMADASALTDENKKKDAQKTPVKDVFKLADLEHQLGRIEKGVAETDLRYLWFVLRKNYTIRRELKPSLLAQCLEKRLPESEFRATLLGWFSQIPDPVDVEAADSPDVAAPAAADAPVEMEQGADESAESESVKSADIPEVHVYLQLLAVIFLVDSKLYAEACECSTHLVKSLSQWKRRTISPFAARVYFYYSRAHELVGALESIRPNLLAALQTATLRCEEGLRGTLMTLLLRNYLHYDLYDEAHRFVENTDIDHSKLPSSQDARFLYYTGRIAATQLRYDEASRNLSQAIRKAPQGRAHGFRLQVIKWATVVELLMGETPERSTFRSGPLEAYFKLAKSVRIGDVAAFEQVKAQYRESFRVDRTFMLVNRLHQTVIKTGLRNINRSYSRISLAEIAQKLSLDENAVSVAFIVAKAIRDGVIDGVIDHEGQYLQSKELVDVYQTTAPQKTFDAKVRICLEIHNDAVKAMRFSDDLLSQPVVGSDSDAEEP